ncbi:type IV pili methyl-accepting chemotaxis transducer N-terminal domain-containing protein [Chitinibacter bivalviorum]|uniref:Sensor protein n=1 Tax=Chitinibacter bivalviorum TaxID=2739434 RepID=A0A7H9BHE5_9NEIS|nr:histidine kinase [Chitinibacter bivalviorum]QLG87752.1 type IV pili methyl-accepting chemotaxis transducer N-terminal domain-containing protein [Chitinibacter bivalviorum]
MAFRFTSLVNLTIVARLSLALLLLVLPGVFSLVLSGWTANLSAGGGEAINMAGSLRKQSYLIAATALAPPAPIPGSHPNLSQVVAEFEHRLYHSNIQNALPSDAQDPIRIQFNQIESRWRNEIRPSLERDDSLYASVLLPSIHQYVSEIDEFVSELEKAHETRLKLLIHIQWVTLAIVCGVFIWTLYWAYRYISYPLYNMANVADQVKKGQYATRINTPASGEIGTLKTALNRMLDELEASHSQLELRVAEKTSELEQNQIALQLRYRIKALLADHEPDQAIFDQVLKALGEFIPLSNAAVCLTDINPKQHHIPIKSAFKLANNQQEGMRLGCLEQDCASCIDHSHHDNNAINSDTGGNEMVFRLLDSGITYGIMPITIANGVQLAPWQIAVLEDVSRNLGAALAGSRRKQSLHRLALFEERSVIARELHDSLAQALSYLKIQVVRLQSQINDKPDAAQATLQELREGLNAAYRQLRELLTTFRLQINQGGLNAALMATVGEFTERSQLDIQLSNHLLGIELAAEEEIHVLQIVREALANVHHHAQAQSAQVQLAWIGNEIVVSISDDGKGLSPNPDRPQHYGLSIMRDRAQSLGGTITMQSRAPTGTQVTLRFVPTTPFAQNESTLAIDPVPNTQNRPTQPNQDTTL